MASSRTAAVLLAACLAAACAKDSPTAVSPDSFDAQLSRSAAAKMVPFKASYAAAAGLQPIAAELCPTEFGDITQGGGQATHLGRFTGDTFSCVNLATLEVRDGRFAFEGADGSVVRGTYELDGTPLSATVIRLDGTFTVTGGARRFAGASGGGSVTGQVDLAAGTLELSFDGSISSVGSLR
jgi:hypothetical protein